MPIRCRLVSSRIASWPVTAFMSLSIASSIVANIVKTVTLWCNHVAYTHYHHLGARFIPDWYVAPTRNVTEVRTRDQYNAVIMSALPGDP
jgi:hypothetical protein